MVSASPFTHFTAQSAANTGAVFDTGVGTASLTTQISTNGAVTAGAITILGSIDNVTFTPLSAAVITGKTTGASPALANGVLTFTAAGSALISSPNAGGAIRYIRVDVTTTVVGGTITASSIGH